MDIEIYDLLEKKQKNNNNGVALVKALVLQITVKLPVDTQKFPLNDGNLIHNLKFFSYIPYMYYLHMYICMNVISLESHWLPQNM